MVMFATPFTRVTAGTRRVFRKTDTVPVGTGRPEIRAGVTVSWRAWLILNVGEAGEIVSEVLACRMSTGVEGEVDPP